MLSIEASFSTFGKTVGLAGTLEFGGAQGGPDDEASDCCAGSGMGGGVGGALTTAPAFRRCVKIVSISCGVSTVAKASAVSAMVRGEIGLSVI